MTLPLVNQFLKTYEVWQTRKPTQQEIHDRILNGLNPFACLEDVRVNFLDKIDTPLKAAEYLAKNQFRNEIDNYVTESLEDINSGYQLARKSMPNSTPDIFSVYQNKYGPNIDMTMVNNEIINNGDTLTDGQVLFHGGGMLNAVTEGNSIFTHRPLSTSFCPVKAINNGSWRGKYYHENQANLIILTVKSMSKLAFIYKINGTQKGHEKEVLIESNAKITVTNRILLNKNYNVFRASASSSGTERKQVSFFAVYATIS